MVDLSGLIFRLNDHGQGPELVRQVFFERGWLEFDEETQEEWDWNLWWRNSHFRTSDYDKIMPWQRINHYPRSSIITKKDGLARNLRRMRGVYGANIYNFSPTAFNLPHDYTRFVTEYTKQKEQQKQNGINNNMYWICKPADMSRGRGIFVFKDLSELTYNCTAVVQRYISRPFLIGGYKFDLRIYVSVPSFHPLRIYIYEEGLVRFGTDKYDLDKLGNLFSHLTNTSINKHSPMYAADKDQIGLGCKWTITQLRHYFRQENINDHPLWMKIINIITLTLIIQHGQVPRAENCYELYGFDIIIDDNLKPWLLEVNFSPAMSCHSQIDIQVKKPMLHDMCDMLEFKVEDCQRGRKTHRRNRMNKLRSYDTEHFKYRKRYQGNDRSRKLPRISRMQRSASSGSDSCRPGSSDESNDESSSDPDPIPVVAGCGLPSVQQTPRSYKAALGLSYAACDQDFKSRPQVHNPLTSNFDDWRTRSPARSLGKYTMSSHMIQQHDSAYSDIGTYKKKPREHRRNLSLNIMNTCSSVAKLSMRESKGSNATARLASGSSSPSEQSLPEKSKSSPRLVFDNKDKTYRSASLENFSTGEHIRNHHQLPSGHRDQRTCGLQSSEDSFNNPFKERSSFSQQHRNPSQGNQVVKEDTYGNADNCTDSKLTPKSSVAKGKSASWSKYPSSSQKLNFQFPFNSRSKPKFVQRYGGFHLVFPFNEITQKCAMASTLDLRVVVGECHRALQQTLQSGGKKCFTSLWVLLKQHDDCSSEMS